MTIDKIHTVNAAAASHRLLEARQSIEVMKKREKSLRDELAEAILLDAMEQPSRVLRLDLYWRTMGIQAADLERMMAQYLNKNDNPDLAGIVYYRYAIRRKYSELDAEGNPTGEYFEKIENCPLIINLGDVKPPRVCTQTCGYNHNGRCTNSGDGRCNSYCEKWQRQTEEPRMGRASIIAAAPFCNDKKCPRLKKGKKCPFAVTTSEGKAKCPYNREIIASLVNSILRTY